MPFAATISRLTFPSCPARAFVIASISAFDLTMNGFDAEVGCFAWADAVEATNAKIRKPKNIFINLFPRPCDQPTAEVLCRLEILKFHGQSPAVEIFVVDPRIADHKNRPFTV